MPDTKREKIHFVTGKLAEQAVREVVHHLSNKLGFSYSIQVLPITVAALMTPTWLLRHMLVPDGTSSVVLPGFLQTGIQQIRDAFPDCVVECGPKDIRDLPEFFGEKKTLASDFGEYNVEIIAEINYAPRLELSRLIEVSNRYIEEGANVIDLGCEPGQRWSNIADAVQLLRDHDIRCSVDTFDPFEAEKATRAGAELVLSVNRTNREHSVDWGCEVVVVPDSTDQSDFLSTIEESIEFLEAKRVPFRIDPILEPIGCGFAESLLRYRQVREHFPEVPMMMGVGNLTELTDCDSAGINMILLAICEEWKIFSVLTTQVIPWAQSSVRECDVSRRMVAYANRHRQPPKRLDPQLVMLRDPKVNHFSQQAISQLAATIKDNNYRILIDGFQIHLIAADVHIVGTDPFLMMSQLLELPQSKNVDESHAFYLGFELAKAMTALTLGKSYNQDVALNWGMLTQNEPRHRIPRRRKRT